MSVGLAKFFSYLFQPLLMPTYLFAILIYLLPSSYLSLYNDKIKLWLLLVVFVSTFAIPLIGVFAFRLTGSIENYEMAKREDRVRPFFFITVFYIVAAVLMVSRLNINSLINTIMISSSVLVLIATLITIKWKISIHSIGMAGVIGYLVGLNSISPDPAFFIPVVCWLIFTGLTMSARLFLNVHNPMQTYTGSLVGFFVAFLSMIIFVRI